MSLKFSNNNIPTGCIPFGECRAKTCQDGSPGTFVFDHCRYAGYVAEVLLSLLPKSLRQLFPDNCPFLVSLHDIGKVSPGFQGKYFIELLREKAPSFVTGVENGGYTTDHASIGAKALLRIFGMAPDHPLVRAIAAHHGFAPYRLEFTQDGSWQEERKALVAALSSDFDASSKLLMAKETDVELLTGLICVSDWIASDESFFPTNESPLSQVEGRARARKAVLECGFFTPCFRRGLSFCDIFGFDPYPEQQTFLDASSEPGVYVLEAPMGMGKTESALYAAYRLIEAGYHSGLYFALPTRLTSDRIHERVKKFLEVVSMNSNTVKLAHGQAWLKEFEIGSEGSDGNQVPPWFNPSKRGLLFPFAVGTIDQALLSVLNVKHSFVRSFGLAGKVVVLDEVHSYDAYTGTLLDELVLRLRKLGCTVIILSATLTDARRAFLLGPDAPVTSGYPILTGIRLDGTHIVRKLVPPPSRSVQLRWIDASAESPFAAAVGKAREGCNVLCIANTISTAQEWYRIIKSELRDGDRFPVGLLHSRFTREDRERIEDEWIACLGKASERRPRGSILVATQIIEQSVDIDADWMLSELAPVDMLLQRLGRLWRHERKTRPINAPELVIMCAHIPKSLVEMKADKKAMSDFFGLGCWVYAPYVLLRSFETLRNRETICIPDDIRGLLETVYSDDIPCSDLHFMLFVDMQKRKEELRQLAKMAQGDALPIRDDDEESAGTRYDNYPTVPLLILRDLNTASRQGEAKATLLDGSVVVISSFHRDFAVTRALYRNIVRVPPNYAIRLEESDADVLSRHFLTSDMPHICFWNSESGILRLRGSGVNAGYRYTQTVGAIRIKLEICAANRNHTQQQSSDVDGGDCLFPL